MDKEIVPPMKDDEESSIDFKELFFLFFSHWKWFVASVVIFLAAAVFWLMRQNDVYTVSSMILMKGENSSTPSSEAVVMEGFGLMSAGKMNTDDEIGIMRSKNVLSQVVGDLKLYVTYYEQQGHAQGRAVWRHTAFPRYRFFVGPLSGDTHSRQGRTR